MVIDIWYNIFLTLEMSRDFAWFRQPFWIRSSICHAIIEIKQNFNKMISRNSVSILPVDGPAALGAAKYVGKV